MPRKRDYRPTRPATAGPPRSRRRCACAPRRDSRDRIGISRSSCRAVRRRFDLPDLLDQFAAEAFLEFRIGAGHRGDEAGAVDVGPAPSCRPAADAATPSASAWAANAARRLPPSLAASMKLTLSSADSSSNASGDMMKTGGIVGVAAERQELLHLVELGGPDGGDRVFLAVELAGAQCLEQQRKGQRRGLDAQRLETRQQHVGLRHADLEALEIGRASRSAAWSWSYAAARSRPRPA